MGWLDDLGDAVGGAVDAVADVVQAVVETIADVAADAVETAGNAAGGWVGQFGGAATWAGGVISGATNILAAAIKLAAGIVSGVAGGVIRLLGGALTWNEELFKKGILDFFYGIAGGLIYLGGMILSQIQKVFPVQAVERGLTKAETDVLRRIFMNSLSLYNVRLVEGSAGLYGSGTFATTVGNTIYMRAIPPNTVASLRTLVHECVHVWQYQNIGSRYTAEALLAQGAWPAQTTGTGTTSIPAYNWEVVEVNRGNTDWNRFNREAQAEFIQDLWRIGTLTFNGNTRRGDGAFFDLQDVQASFGNGTADFTYTGAVDSEHPLGGNSTVPVDYTDLATEAVGSMRARINLRLSQRL